MIVGAAEEGADLREARIQVGSKGPEQYWCYWALLWQSDWLVQLWANDTFLALLLELRAQEELEEGECWMMRVPGQVTVESRLRETDLEEGGKVAEHLQLPLRWWLSLLR